ncbi:MAG: putative membrane protein [Rickettsiales bacterium]|jgi:uncharacterized membrane protein
MEFLQNILIFLLIFSSVAGLAGVFYCKNYLKKISCLSVAYINLIIIFIIFVKNSEKASELLGMVTTILILFSITIAVGIGIIANISKLDSQRKSNK